MTHLRSSFHLKGDHEKIYQVVFLYNWKLSERTPNETATIQNQSRSYIPIITMIIWKMNNSERSQNQSTILPRAFSRDAELIKPKPIFIHHFSNIEIVILVELSIISSEMKNIISERATSYSQSGFSNYAFHHNDYQLPSIQGFQLWEFNSESISVITNFPYLMKICYMILSYWRNFSTKSIGRINRLKNAPKKYCISPPRGNITNEE